MPEVVGKAKAALADAGVSESDVFSDGWEEGAANT